MMPGEETTVPRSIPFSFAAMTLSSSRKAGASNSVNQQLIADRLNISRTTVSRCFTNHPGINPTTRSKVFGLAAEMGYQYLNSRAPTRGKVKPRSIGVLICSDVEEFGRPDYESPGVELLPGISEFAQTHNWQIDVQFVSPTDTHLTDPSYAKLNLKRCRWNGLLLTYPFPPGIIEELALRFSCVSLVEQYGPASVDCVDVDHFKGISSLMDTLTRLGHRHIGFFSRKYAVEAVWSYRRFSAYVEKLTGLGLPFREKDVIHLDISDPKPTDPGYDRAVTQMKAGVTAWICAADHQAYDLIIALKQRGYSVPRDVSITGFDGILRPRGAPALETVRIPYYEIGFAAARRLHDRMHKRSESSQHVLLECRLQPGETIGRPR